MTKKRFFYLVALMCIVNLNYSCDKETDVEVEQLDSIDRKEAKEGDS